MEKYAPIAFIDSIPFPKGMDPAAPAVISMFLGWAGSSNTYNNTTGYRALVNTYLGTLSNYAFTFLNTSLSGFATFPNLILFDDLISAEMIIFDQSNDDSGDYLEYEAYIRRCILQGKRIVAILNPAWFSLGNEQINNPANKTALTQQIAICDHYGITRVDGWQLVIDYVNAGGDLADIFADTAHWSPAIGFPAMADSIKSYTPDKGSITPPVPDFLNTAAEDYMNSSLRVDGVDRDSDTGTWTEAGTSISSSEAGATITFSGTFRKFGIFNSIASYPTCTITIDGGAPIANFTAYPNGYDIGTRTTHTIVLTVTTSLTIDQFWAI